MFCFFNICEVAHDPLKMEREIFTLANDVFRDKTLNL